MILNSRVTKGTQVLGLPINDLEYCNITYICIKEPHGAVQVPDNLKGITYPLLYSILKDVHPADYLYLTVKKGHVQPYTTSMRSGFHVDGFLSNDRNWVFSDSIPTQIAVGQFSVDADYEKSLEQFRDQAYGKECEYLKPHHLYYLDRECVHAPSLNSSGEVVVRTFIKLVASPNLFNGIGNAWNYKLPHIKPTSERGNSRNHTVV